VWRVVSLLGAAAVAAGSSTVRVVANDDGLEVGFGPWGIPARRISSDEITAVRVEPSEVLRFGGYGYRIKGRDTRVIVRSGPTLVVDLRHGGSFGVTVPDAAAFASVLGTAVGNAADAER
jgi:hypothetical protein